MYIVTAHLDDDTWAYGPFPDRFEAEMLRMKLAEKYPSTEYEVGDLFSPDDEELLRELAA